MSVTSEEARPQTVLRYLHLPKRLADGTYDANGRRVSATKDPGAVRLVLHSLPGGPKPWQVWGVIDEDLAPGQFGQVVFLGVDGSAVPGGAFTEWDRRTATPFFTDRLLTIYSVSRGVGRARVMGRNDARRPVSAAAGLLFVPPMSQTQIAREAKAAAAQASEAPAPKTKTATAPNRKPEKAAKAPTRSRRSADAKRSSS